MNKTDKETDMMDRLIGLMEKQVNVNDKTYDMLKNLLHRIESIENALKQEKPQ